ncbi:hypothetical protein V9T40_014770 [Parthenolecanium corni]|uniref:Uncharacterized protein n=1 Tax=Parthenolecanium corni TaxID=536013 RepID=A0AAN9T6L5_9HEMI
MLEGVNRSWYDHFATLCETLPASIPSLAVNLLVTSRGYFDNSLRKHLVKALACGVTSNANNFGRDADSQSSFLNLDNDMFLWYQFSRCSFNGSQFYRILSRWHNLQREINEYLLSTRVKKAWLTSYNVRHNFTSPLRIRELMADEDRLYHSLISMIQSISEALDEVFDRYTVTEWIEQNIYPTVLELEELQRNAQRLKTPQIWPRRPFAPLVDLQRLGVSLYSNHSATKG